MIIFTEWLKEQGAYGEYMKYFDWKWGNFPYKEPLFFVRMAFAWENTDRGREYWREIDDRWKSHIIFKRGPIVFLEDYKITTANKELRVGEVKKNTGGSSLWYELPEGATQLQDLIEYRNMNGNIKDIFKACYRMGYKEGVSDEYNLRKMVYYSLRDLGRLLNTKDYLRLTNEVIGDQTKKDNK